MSGLKSRRKGQIFERALRAHFDPWLVTYSHIGASEEDLILETPLFTLSVEAKNHARPDLAGWWAQAVEQAGEDYLPVVIHKRHGRADAQEQWVTMDVATFTRILNLLRR